MKKTNTSQIKRFGETRLRILFVLSLLMSMASWNTMNAQCALACNGHTQVSLDENCEAEITPAMMLNADTTICPGGDFEVVVSYHGHVIPTSPVVTCAEKDMTLTVMVRDRNSGNTCWGEILVEDKLPPTIDCGSDTLYCYEMPKYTGPKITDNCTKAAILHASRRFPWGFSEYIETMNDVFGGGNWDNVLYFNADPLSVFSCKYDVLWLEGGDQDGDDLFNFLTPSTLNLMEEWVRNGGRLFINSAPNPSNINIPFGFGVTMDGGVFSDSAFIADPSATIFEGPYCPTMADFDGNFSGHGLICPPGMDILIENENDDPLLIGALEGDGLVYFGSMTMYPWWTPQEEAGNIYRNILQALRSHAPPMVEMTKLDERIFPMRCNEEFVKRIEVDYQATDMSGNKSSVCTQTLYLRRFPLEEVECPKQWTLEDDCPIQCDHLELGLIETLPNGAPVPEYTGVPTIDGIPLWPPNDFYCNTTVTYEDIVLPKIGCVKKIMRVWEITEWWCNTDSTRACPQLIEIVDTLPPTITRPDDIYKTTDGGYECEAEVYLHPLEAEDVCSPTVRVDVRYPGGFQSDFNGGYVTLPDGWHDVTYFAYDDCYNVDSVTIQVHVEDLTPPVAICDRYTVVGLTYDSVAHVYAETFDDGTYDDCKLDSFGVRRMDRGAACRVPDIGEVFRPYVEFCCADIGTPVMVVFRAWDKSGNYNDCMVEVEVQDKILPHIYCPPNITISCGYHFDPNDLSAHFGKVVEGKKNREPIVINDPNLDYDGPLIDGHAYDNCDLIITTDSVFDISQCNVGTITRTFTATDRNGSVSCTQTITIENFEDFVVDSIWWPADFDTIGCLDPNNLTEDVTGRPIFHGEDQCDQLGYSYDDHIFPFINSPEACLKIIRKWKVIDWCQFEYNPRTGQYEYEKWTHEQVIKVLDTEDPRFVDVTPDTTFCTFDTTCTNGPAVLIATSEDDCTPDGEMYWEYHIDYDCDGIINVFDDGSGATIDASGDYPLGTHCIKYIFEDRCGNKIVEERMFTIVNCKNPTPYCKNGIVVDLMPMDTNRDGTVDFGMIETWASDFDLGSFGPCGNMVKLSFSSDTTDKNKMFDCDSVGQRNVEIWVTDCVTGNQSFCRTFIIIQDNNNACSGNFNGGAVSGLVMTEDKQEVNSVSVNLIGSNFTPATTDDVGEYAFPMMPYGGNYSVEPDRNTDHVEGVTTRDLIVIQRHLLGMKELNSPYKYIAADANRDKEISVQDIVELRRLVLGSYSALPMNTSWRFVDEDYVFPDPTNPFSPEFPEEYTIDNFSTNMPEVNFVAVKVGDVDNSIELGLKGNKTRSGKTLSLETEDQHFEGGSSVLVSFKSSDFREVLGYQFTLNFDPAMLSFEGVESGYLEMSNGNFNYNFLNEGIITTSWNHVSGVSAGAEEILFTVRFTTHTTGQLSDAISINSRMTPAEAYSELDEIMNVGLDFRGETAQGVGFKLYQNHPNPFNNNTVIGFDMPETGEVMLTVYDVTGKVLRIYNMVGSKGYNSVEVKSEDLNASGVLYYQLDSQGYTATKKMVVLK